MFTKSEIIYKLSNQTFPYVKLRILPLILYSIIQVTLINWAYTNIAPYDNCSRGLALVSDNQLYWGILAMKTLKQLLKTTQQNLRPLQLADWRINPKENDICWTIDANGIPQKILCEPKFRQFFSNYPSRIFLTEKDAEYFGKRRAEYELALIQQLYGLNKQMDLFEGTSQMEIIS